MCRFIAYRGPAIRLHELLLKPKNSLIHQSIHASEAEETLNGDGFGLGWYDEAIDNTPGLFVSTQPAWSDQNLVRLAPKLRSHCFFAHVRAASQGVISRQNCHPFIYQTMQMMHNGTVVGFPKIKRQIQQTLSDPIFDWLQGSTDSEHVFALMLDYLHRHQLPHQGINIRYAMEYAVKTVRHLQQQAGIEGPTQLNLVVSNGDEIIASRLCYGAQGVPHTLYYAVGDHVWTEQGVCHLSAPHGEGHAVLLSSEKLDDHMADWQLVPAQHGLLIDNQSRVQMFAWQ